MAQIEFFYLMHGCLKFSSIDAVRLEIFCKELSTEKREQAHLPIICFPIFSLSAKESYKKRSIGQTSPALRGDHQQNQACFHLILLTVAVPLKVENIELISSQELILLLL